MQSEEICSALRVKDKRFSGAVKIFANLCFELKNILPSVSSTLNSSGGGSGGRGGSGGVGCSSRS